MAGLTMYASLKVFVRPHSLSPLVEPLRETTTSPPCTHPREHAAFSTAALMSGKPYPVIPLDEHSAGFLRSKRVSQCFDMQAWAASRARLRQRLGTVLPQPARASNSSSTAVAPVVLLVRVQRA